MHIGTCQSVLGVPMHILATWSHAHQCWVKLFTIPKKTVYNKKKEKGKQGDKWIHAHQSRSAAYTSGRVPCSLFKTAWLIVLDVPALHMQCVVVCWWWSSFSDWLRSTACSVLNTCSVTLLPVWPMYTIEHSTQGIKYTTPLRSLTGTGSFKHTSIWRRVHWGRNTTLTPRWCIRSMDMSQPSHLGLHRILPPSLLHSASCNACPYVFLHISTWASQHRQNATSASCRRWSPWVQVM